ncbi:ThuA domain-containing protein [Dyadobacter sp. NIV53]|uniref:ThuA domain-containing protein n=1 Tax=Dyadobacter sp. NIV53 TaxID=2861765 RepID=UPI001C889ABC|nr:ThuA domain-containing protein [Dyadobacter sp. NIV53]
MSAKQLIFSFLIFSSGLFTQITFAQSTKIKVLVFSKTVEFRHESISAGKAALTKLAADKGFEVSFTEDATQFKDANLRKYNAVVFLNTTGDLLNPEQQTAFERYIQAGGGYVGTHGAADAEYGWPWYGKLVGAYFLDHPSPDNIQKGKFIVTMKDHWATQGMPDEFERTDEFYSFKQISPRINVVLKIDEKSYKGGKNPDFHPMSWYQEFDGGRSFYTALGHTDEAFADPLLLNHLWAGIKYAAGLSSAGGDAPKPLDYTKSRPEENRFTKVVLADKLDEPMELTVLGDGRILFIQRKGDVRLYNTKTKELKTIAKLPVSTKYISKDGKESQGEDGLLGLSKDPNFAQNHWIYMYYSDPNKSQNVLARFELKGDELLIASQKVLLEISTTREENSHTAGSIAWDRQGNLYLSTGDNTNPHASGGYSPSDEREGRNAWDAQKSASNTNDLRGKIIRIKPQPDGTYTIPEGNLFLKSTAAGDSSRTRPEIYSMGHRNPFRISVDQKTGFVYWGEVGPDAAKPDSSRGPAGQDEIGQARKPGNFGWPYFVGDNKPYFKYDFVSGKSGILADSNAPVNTSVNNTGLQNLPPAEKAFIWYPYDESKEFPLLGSGGRNAMAGPVYYTDEFKNSPRAFPTYYEGKLFIYDWMRGWIMNVSMDKNGNYQSMERFMPAYKFSNPMDMEFSSDGDLYMLEYGSGWFSQNEDARLIRIEYNGGNRKPQIEITANKMGGSAPLALKLSAKGTVDSDGDALSYSWKIISKNGFNKIVNTAETALTLVKPGIYKTVLTVSDGKGGNSVESMDITVGNEAPAVSLEMPQSNKSFYAANKPFYYDVKVTDKEDGSLGKGIDPARIAVSIDYLAEGYDKVAISQGHRSVDQDAVLTIGKKLIEASDCKGCHSTDKKSIGPAYREVAAKYKGDGTAVERLTKKIISGGAGVWGETPMAAHPQLSASDAAEMVKYILNINESATANSSLPAKGSYTASVPKGDKGTGVYMLRASFSDKGAPGLPPLKAEETLVLRNAKIDVHGFDVYDGVRKVGSNGANMILPDKSGSFMVLKQLDLNAIREFRLKAVAPKMPIKTIGGRVQLRLDSPAGTIIGESILLEPAEKGFAPTDLIVPVKLPAGLADKRHDVYVVFVNEKPEQGSLMIVLGTEFILNTIEQ